MGGLLSAAKDYEGALKRYQEVRSIGGDAVDEMVNIGRVYELMGNTDAVPVEESSGRAKRFTLTATTPTGLQAFKSIRRVRWKVTIDYSDFDTAGGPRRITSSSCVILRCPARRTPSPSRRTSRNSSTRSRSPCGRSSRISSATGSRTSRSSRRATAEGRGHQGI